MIKPKYIIHSDDGFYQADEISDWEMILADAGEIDYWCLDNIADLPIWPTEEGEEE